MGATFVQHEAMIWPVWQDSLYAIFRDAGVMPTLPGSVPVREHAEPPAVAAPPK